jgi:hypothetical protein
MKWDNIMENKFVYVSNINFNNILLSVYNIAFLNDFIGISNTSVRKRQIKQLKEIIRLNTLEIESDTYNSYDKRNIHVLTCLSNITELLNDDINNEYLYFIRYIKCIDIYRYTQTVKCIGSDNKKDATTICGLRTNYILLFCDDVKLINNLPQLENIIYKNNKLIITNSIIYKSLTCYNNYPIISSFLLKKYMPTNQSFQRTGDEKIDSSNEDEAFEIK